MTQDAWITSFVIVGSFILLLVGNLAADAVLLSAAVLLMLVGVLTPQDVVAGFSNLGLATVGVLFVIASALTRTGALSAMFERFLGSPKSLPMAQARMMFPVSFISSILNNTPVVAMMIPYVSDWAKRLNLPLSQLMMPLSYAAIVGGVCTVIGTSTNLVVNDMLLESSGEGLDLFELAWVGVPIVLLTVVFVMIFSRKLLPSKNVGISVFGDAKQYTIEMVVEDQDLDGQTVSEAGLRNLPGMYLIEIIRNGYPIVAVSSTQVIRHSDRLVFAGDVDSVVDLQKHRGLRPAEKQVFKLHGDRSQRLLVEVVLGSAFPYLGMSVRDGQFRMRYGAAIIAICREGVHLKQRIGDVVLKKGDILLLEAPTRFATSRRYERDFLLMSEVQNSRPVLHNRRYIALLILVVQIGLVSSGLLSLFEAGALAVVLLLLSRCISLAEARDSVDWQILIVIGASMSLGYACQKTGITEHLAEICINLFSGSPLGTLAAFYIVGSILTALVSNMAAAVLLFPVAQSTAQQLDLSIVPFAVVIMIAASVSLATPIGYQTNLMVYGPGNYRNMDFIKMGVPLSILIGILTVFLVPFIWTF